MSALCPMDGLTFDPRRDYGGRPYLHASTRRRYCSHHCAAAAAREAERERKARAAARAYVKSLAALEAAGQGVLLEPADLVLARPVRKAAR